MVGIGSIFNPLLLAFAASNDSFNELSTIKIMTDNDVNERCCQNNDVGVISKLRSLGMEKKELPHHTDLVRRASILVPLFERDDSKIHVLFTQRPKTMKSHGGEVCFPGGKQDPEDEGDDVRTAMREAHEEVGLHPQFINGIARMETVESKHSLCVTPIIGLIQPSSVAEPSQLKLNSDEVEAAFTVPLEYFADPDNCDSITRVNWSGGDFLMRTYLYDDPDSGRQFKIWGLTAHVVHQVATLAFAVNNI
mmetsp:Transcript_12658/g.22723  ORF Transcript_12658/g.22723 Transcript_12658/m.22723 type:complete len:250 (-) Transcript_12658:6-755(-)